MSARACAPCGVCCFVCSGRDVGPVVVLCLLDSYVSGPARAGSGCLFLVSVQCTDRPVCMMYPGDMRISLPSACNWELTDVHALSDWAERDSVPEG